MKAKALQTHYKSNRASLLALCTRGNMNLRDKVSLDKIINQSYGNTAGLIIQKNQEIVFESYYNGATMEDTIHVASVTKSVISILIGINSF